MLSSNRIICAAIHFKTNKEEDERRPKNISTGFVVCGRRHHDCFGIICSTGFEFKKYKHIQGFITTNNLFVDRKEAAKIAFEAGQTDTLKKSLFSEDLY